MCLPCLRLLNGDDGVDRGGVGVGDRGDDGGEDRGGDDGEDMGGDIE